MRAWPRVFAQPPVGTQPLTLEESALVVLCQGEGATQQIAADAKRIVGLLNRLLPADDALSAVEAVEATRTEIYLARELLTLKLWLRDFDPGF